MNDQKRPKTLLFVPMYNCENQIVRVVDQLAKPEIGSLIDEILFVDNGSPDNTQEVCAQQARDNHLLPKWSVVQNNENYHLGGSHKVAFQHCIDNDFDLMIVFHGDDQATISDIVPYIENGDWDKYDCLLGSRFGKGSKLQGYSTFRTFGNIVFNALFSAACGKWLTDLGSGLNAYNKRLIEKKFWYNCPDSLSFNYYMIFHTVFNKNSMKFFPILWREEDQRSNVKMVSQAWGMIKLITKYMSGPDKFVKHARKMFSNKTDYSFTTKFVK